MTFETVKYQIDMFKGYLSHIEQSIDNIKENYKNNMIIKKRCLENGYNLETFILHCEIMSRETRKILTVVSD